MTQENTSTMQIKVIQNDIGKFNLLSNDKSLSFSMGIFQDNSLVEENGIKAKLYYYGEPDEQDEFDDPFGNITSIFEKCYKYADNIISTRDYKAQCELFYRVFMQNYEQLDAALVEAHKKRTQDKIDKLTKELGWNNILADLDGTLDYLIGQEIKKYQKWMDSSIKEKEQLKEDSPRFHELTGRIMKYEKDIDRLKQKLTNVTK